MGTLPPVFVEFIAGVGGFKAGVAGVRKELTKVEKAGGGNMARLGVIGKAALAGIGLAAAGAAIEATKMAGDFQQQMTRVVTGAGEARSNLKMVGDGVLSMAGEVGQSTKQLTDGLYLVESAGYHGADALSVLKNAAMGAKVGNAELGTTADAVTTVLNAYHMGAGKAAEATNALIAAEGQGKTNLEALAGSMATVLPIASAAHVGLNEVLGAMSTMTAEGTPAADAATYLKQTIGQLSNPSAKAAQEMKSLGLSSVEVSKNLGRNGLASTLTMLTDAIKSKMGPAGTVLIEHLKKAASNTTAFQKVLANLPPAQQTYVGALASMVGGTKSMQAALELTGDNMATFKKNTEVISEKVKTGGKNIEGWADVQKNFNQRLAEAKGHAEALGIKLGEKLLPVATSLLQYTMDLVTWFGKHKDTAIALGIAVGSLAGILALYKAGVIAATVAVQAKTVALTVWKGMQLAVSGATKVWAAAQWLLNIAMDANPIGLIIIGVAALIAVIALLWTHSAAFRKFWIGLWADIWGFLKGVGHWFAHDFVDFFRHAWQWIQDKAKETADNIHKRWSTVINFFSSLPGKIIDFFKSLPGKFLNVGHDIVMGIIHGVENAGGALFDSLGNLASSALKSAKSFLGISSPSRLFAEQVGRWIPHGIAQGVDAHAGVATAAVSRLAAGMPTSLALPGVRAGYTGAAGAGGTSGDGMLQADIWIDGAKFARAIVPYVQRTRSRNVTSQFA